jgi:hypothetical protein
MDDYESLSHSKWDCKPKIRAWTLDKVVYCHFQAFFYVSVTCLARLVSQ